jgi:hypothetical protein
MIVDQLGVEVSDSALLVWPLETFETLDPKEENWYDPAWVDKFNRLLRERNARRELFGV